MDTVVRNDALAILDKISICKEKLMIICNDGGVHINSETLEFTYLGKFGGMCSSVINRNAIQSISEKIMIVAYFKHRYSCNCGGFNVVTY